MTINQEIFLTRPRTICEVGTGGPGVLQCGNLLDLDAKFIFVEPNPVSFSLLAKAFPDTEKFKLYNAAIAATQGEGIYYNWNAGQENASGFIEGVVSPMMVNHKYEPLPSKDATIVDFIRFESIDDGTIDGLFVDAEGAEWYVLENIKSRPRFISIETHGQAYQNSNIAQINKWLAANGYRLSGADESDSLFIKD